MAIVGRSNSGKSTLVKSIAALLQPREGKILHDDTDVTTLNLSSLRQFIGLTLQHDHIFSGSITHNIALGDPNPCIERVIYAATQANAHDFIEQLPGTYDMKISDSDMLLSLGQKQSLAIARVIYRDPSVFIFDEAMNATDIEFGQMILGNLEKIRQRRSWKRRHSQHSKTLRDSRSPIRRPSTWPA